MTVRKQVEIMMQSLITSYLLNAQADCGWKPPIVLKRGQETWLVKCLQHHNSSACSLQQLAWCGTWPAASPSRSSHSDCGLPWKNFRYFFQKKIFCYDCVNLQSDQWRQREHLPKTKKVPQNSLADAQPKEIFFQYYPHKMCFISMYSECLQVVRIAFSSSFVVAFSFLCECKNFEESLNCCIWSGAIEEFNCFNSAICKLVFFLTFLVVF